MSTNSVFVSIECSKIKLRLAHCISGSGKSRLLIEIIGLFVKAEHICQKRGKLKILVTGPSNDVVDALARNLEKYRNHQNIDAGKLN